MNIGEIIIKAVIRSGAVESAIATDGGTIFAWAANAPEQIEAAIAEAGYELKPNRGEPPDNLQFSI